MRHAPVVQTVMAICAALVAAGCTPSESLTDADPARPGIDTDAASVDGLIVGHRLMASDEPELALRAYYRAAGELGLNADVLSALGSANLRLGRIGQAEVLLRQALEEEEEFVPPSTTSASC
jgi:Flp pilus assembly protein TadD